MQQLRLLTASVLLLSLAAPSEGAAQGDVPPLSALTERISLSLGGAEGGRKVLEAAADIEFVYRRTLHEVLSDGEITADHRYVAERERTRIRLDVRIVRGDGKDSATILDGEEAHLLVDGAAHVVKADNVRSRLREFGPDRLFSVPLALAADGRQLLGDTDFTVQERRVDPAGARLVLVALDDAGEETARLEVDARNYRPTSVAFRSPAGMVAYRYGDYREVAPGLIVPFEREFSRNGRTVSTTRVLAFRLSASPDPARFNPEVTSLGPIPHVPPPGKP